ncbi:MAG: orotidine-5'-phosphate decarboxylase [Succinatimonas sp.]|nr:orotidine-5'-phosphate decarboxylase [Succinatimonas sp.]
MFDPKVIVALDYNSADEALSFVSKVSPEICRLKVGNELFTAAGPQFVGKLCEKGFKVFLDLKFHDIPNTVSKACEAAAKQGVWLVNVHALGGAVMMSKAAQTLAKYQSRPKLIAVTVLTSMDREQLGGVGLDVEPAEQVKRLAKLACDCGLDGVVSSAREVAMIKDLCGKNFWCVTPGIRPADSALGDQKRVMTPSQAISEGSDYLVIGRPITQSADPVAALNKINEEINALI